jgi:hypothetical protein
MARGLGQTTAHTHAPKATVNHPRPFSMGVNFEDNAERNDFMMITGYDERNALNE